MEVIERLKMANIPAVVQEYIDHVETEKFPVCEDQKLMVSFLKNVLEKESVFFDENQLDKYLSYERHFPFKLFAWERFCFAVHNTLYSSPGVLRFPILFICVGRGAGKTGFSDFENFCLLTPTNGVKNYDIYTFATSEDQAKMAWNDLYELLESNPAKYKRFFKWTKEYITNTQTNSTWYYCTSSYKTKDGQRPGKVDFDEYHAYENYKMISVAKTGLGKKALPRQTITTTNGIVRGGPFDDALDNAVKILNEEIPDNGWFPFICRIDAPEEVHKEECWYKANPSLQYFPHLLAQIRLEYSDFAINPTANSDFETKRMNRPPAMMENEVTSWDNLLNASRDFDKKTVEGYACTAGIDFASTIDMISAGLLWKIDGVYYYKQQTWISENSPDLKRIKAPLREWESLGHVVFVKGAEIPPELVATWIANTAAEYRSEILKVGLDKYRYTLMSKALRDVCFAPEKEYGNNVKLLRPSDEMANIPIITSAFANSRIVWGDIPLMRWAANNSKIEMSKHGNMTYEKIEPKSRKTDPFKAFVAALCASSEEDNFDSTTETGTAEDVYNQVFSY